MNSYTKKRRGENVTVNVFLMKVVRSLLFVLKNLFWQKVAIVA